MKRLNKDINIGDYKERSVARVNLMTIITPTYNRAYTLRKVYDSLRDQTNLDFKWLVIDDGSTDDTEALISSLKSDSPFDIEYIKKENGGKASAINMALDIIDTPYCTCLDSDDWFTNKAMEIVLYLLREEANNDECCGVIGLKATSNGVPTGSGTIPQNYKYINTMEAYFDLNIRSEFATFYKSEIAKKYRFPIIKGERFMPPSWFHYTVGENYKFRVCWNNLCLFEYMEDGLTKNKKSVIVKNPKSYTLIKGLSFKYSKTFKQKMKNGIMYDCGCIISKNKAWFSESPRKGMAVLCYPFAWVVYLIRFKKQINSRE